MAAAKRLLVQLHIVLAFAFLLDGAAALRMAIMRTECLTEEVANEGDIVTGSFVVLDHQSAWAEQHPGMDLGVTGPGNNHVYSTRWKVEDKFTFRALKPGPYKFCFTNHAPAPKSVIFQVHVGHTVTPEEIAKTEHFDPLALQIGKVSEALALVVQEQAYLRAREERHRITNESTSRRVVFYSFIETAGIVSASLLQVFFLRRLFEKRGKRVSV
eukprot:TRINITY_DN4039_c0_g1_i1.p1 TRINITY_DN4039_c0_g1~~TRINITY_DN4039_c0_g1_i1.p1  ORF type:complete len:214 (+),score=62.37 TRINITY_DN4039_c0_g1_i1:117-758(+)